MLPVSNLFARLAEGHAARITVVTPNARLARALQAEFDSFQSGKKQTSWEAPDILPFGAFVARLYEDALYASPGEAGLPRLLTPAQEQWLWQDAVSNSNLLSVADTAEQCRQAWKLVHEWRIGRGQGNEDAQAFGAWSLKYREATAGRIDAARLPDLVSALLKDESIKKPALVVSYGFDIVTPQATEFLAACAAQGAELAECRPEPRKGMAAKTSFISAKEELEAAAAWARARLENRGRAPNSFLRIGIVIPDLEKRRAEVARVFSRVLAPGAQLPGSPQAELPFNISIGIPLDRYPVVALALALLEFSHRELKFESVSNLIRSPFIGGAETELVARAQLDVRLRRKLDASASLAKLISNVEGTPLLRESLERLYNENGKAPQAPSRMPSDWARHFSVLLQAAGFPGERGLDSAEFQAREKWHDALAELARLEGVCPAMSFSQALSVLKRYCRETLFQPESEGDVPIQVLGVLESAGAQFDHLWVSGLSDQAWPLAARANPFVPIALQRKAGIPQAGAETSLELDRRITAGWQGAAPEVVFSWFERDEDREVSPSPLIAAIPAAAVQVPAYPRLRDSIFEKKKIELITDSKAPPVPGKAVRGGTRVLSDQAACPFRAFAAWRLGAQPLKAPADGLDELQRGSLIHALMKNLWGNLKGSKALDADCAPAIDAAAAAAVKDFGLEGRFAGLERARLARIARDWLDVERARPPFEVVAVEEKRGISVAGLEFEARIDRMDKVAAGHVLLDYKTGSSVTVSHWQVPRPHDPQLPLYAVAAKEEVVGVAFAKLRPGDMKFMGLAREEKTVPGVKKHPEWKKLFLEWRTEAERLGKAFAAGEAVVDPKREAATCRNCALHTLCRVYEKSNPLKEGEAGE